MSAVWRRRILCAAVLPIFAMLLVFAPGAQAQPNSIDEIDDELLRRVLPAADTFAPAESSLPIYAGYAGSEPEAEPAGYVFFTPDLPPEEIGYSAPIDMLVGMDAEGVVTGLEIVHYTESYKAIRGDFIHTEGFPGQFSGKDIGEGFRVGRDVDGISRATITAQAVIVAFATPRAGSPWNICPIPISCDPRTPTAVRCSSLKASPGMTSRPTAWCVNSTWKWPMARYCVSKSPSWLTTGSANCSSAPTITPAPNVKPVPG